MMNLTPTLRHDWARTEIQALFELPFNDLLFQAHQIHRENFPTNQIQLSTLLSVKTGACPEDCSYCPQSVRFQTDVASAPLLPLAQVEAAVQAAKAAGASRFCMGAAWRSPKDKDLAQIEAMIGVVKAAGMESCVTLGMLKPHQATQLRAAGLDYYNHNIDTSPEHYAKVISTRTFEDRLHTLDNVREAGIKVCCGGIIGLNETAEDRVGFLQALANMPEHPDSVPINQLIQVAGTPLANGETPKVAALDFVRVIAVARIIMPKSVVRLSAGREQMSDEMQALCFFAGANSIFYGEQLLTTGNPAVQKDRALLANLGLKTA